MLKFNFLIISFLCSLPGFSQTKDLPQFAFENYNFPKAIVVDYASKTKEELNERVVTWADSYFTKNSLIKKKNSENTLLITAQASRFLKVKNLTTDLIYDLKISTRNGKYRMEITSVSYKYYTETREISNLNLVKDQVIKRDLEDNKSLIASFFNDLNQELFNFLSTTTDDW